MRNDDLTKLARWIIPGWLAFLTFISFVVIDLLITLPGQIRLLNEDFLNQTGGFLKNMSGASALFAAIIGAAAGVPVGFVVYQSYFFLRWNSPFSRDGLLLLIPGRQKDINRSIRGLHEELALSTPWRKEIISHPLYELDHGFKWRYIEPFFIQACQKLDKDSDVSIFSRHRYLHEVVHTLGASIGALYLGFISYLIIRLLVEELSISTYLIAVFVITFGFFALLYQEDMWRYEQSLKNVGTETTEVLPILHIKIGGVAFAFPSAQFLFTLAVIHFFANPRFTPPTSNPEFFLRLLLVTLILIAWIISSSSPKTPWGIKVGNGIWSAITLSTAFIIAALPSLFRWIDWPFFSNLLIFLVANLILFSNRKNANEDMLALEYNTIRRYLEEVENNIALRGENYDI